MKKSRSTIFREQLRSAITAAGLTQSDAAKYLGISATTLESWLTDSEKWGRVPHPLMQRGAMYKLWMKTSKTQKKKKPYSGYTFARIKSTATGGNDE